jgi:general secretion pathway protein A
VYREFYGLVRLPFEMTPDPSFLYLGETHREGLAMLHYAVQARKGFVALTGEVGTGKTTLIHSLLSQLDPGVPSAFIFNPRLEPIDFMRMLFDEFGIEAECRTKAEYLMALNHFLIESLAHDRIALLIIDEAQNLSPEMLEEVRLLSNLETPTSKLLQIMLIGQPELDEMLDQPALRQLRQRIVLRHRLRPFAPEDLDHYVDERLRLAGYTGKGIFSRSARKTLFEVTGGVPRLVNVVCDSALLLGYSREQATIDGGIVFEAASELRLTGPGSLPVLDTEAEADDDAGPAEPPQAAARAANEAAPKPAGKAPKAPRRRRFHWFGLFE